MIVPKYLGITRGNRLIGSGEREIFAALAEMNAILHQYADIIVGRLGIPYRSRGVSIIALAVDGSMDAISGMTGRLGKLPGVSVKAAVSKR